MDNPCPHCTNTDHQIHSHEQHIEDLKEEIDKLRKELSNRGWINDNLNKQLVKRLIK